MRESSDRSLSKTLSRRRLLKAGLVAALVLGGVAVAAVRSRGYSLSQDRKLVALSPWRFVVVQHAARRIAAPDVVVDSAIPRADDLDVAGFVDAWVARMHESVRRDLGRFLAYLEHVAPVVLGYGSRFTRLPASDQDHVLASIEASSSDLLRAGFEGLKALVFMGYYRDARTWSIVGYDGPLVGRPQTGWR